MFLSPVNLLSFRNTTKIKAYKSLALMGLSSLGDKAEL